VATLVRYTGLSERTVRTCLDRLEATGIIRPCDPGIVAAQIKRAGRRPQDWDLNLGMVRDDRAKAGIVKLERQSLALPPGSRSWHDPDLTIRPAGAPTAPHARTGSSAPRPTADTHCEGSSNIRAGEIAPCRLFAPSWLMLARHGGTQNIHYGGRPAASRRCTPVRSQRTIRWVMSDVRPRANDAGQWPGTALP
jgi:hypothetical protein